MNVGNRGILRGLFADANKEDMQILVESVVHTDTIPEIKTDKEKISSESATLVNWLTINPTLGNILVVLPKLSLMNKILGNDCIVSQRKFCIHGAVEYLALEEGGQAVYVGSQKEVMYTFDSTRPCTPPIERALSMFIAF